MGVDHIKSVDNKKEFIKLKINNKKRNTKNAAYFKANCVFKHFPKHFGAKQNSLPKDKWA